MPKRTITLPFKNGELEVELSISESGSDEDDQLLLDDFFQAGIQVASRETVPGVNGLAEKFGEDGYTAAVEEFSMAVLGREVKLTIHCRLNREVSDDVLRPFMANEIVPRLFGHIAHTTAIDALHKALEESGYDDRVREMSAGMISEALADLFGGRGGMSRN